MRIEAGTGGGDWFDPWSGYTPRPVPQRWTDPQRSLFESPYHLTVFWGGNGIGKSMVLAEYARRAIHGGLHWQLRGPQTVIIAGNTWTQLGSTLRYFWDGVEPGWFRPGVRYESGGIKGQRLAVYDIVGGPGRGGELRCGTFRAENLAGPRANAVLTDEPLPEDVYNELFPRLFGRDGRMVQTFTVTLKTAVKLGYLWKLTDDPAIPWAGEIRVPITLENMTPRGGLIEVPWTTAAEIERMKSGLSPREVAMRLGLSRTPATDGAYFGAWGEHLRQDWTPAGRVLIAVAIDHGSLPGAQRASLIYVQGQHEYARVHVADHYKGDGRTESEDDAKGILAMLARNGDRPEDVDLWIGDRGHRGDKWGGVKSNLRLQRELARAMGIDTNQRRDLWLSALPENLRRMNTPRKYDGSVWDGCDLLHRLMVAKRFTISRRPECDALDEDFTSWQCSFTDPAKDGIDSVRYGVSPLVEGRRR